jgi:hypothetical protein
MPPQTEAGHIGGAKMSKSSLCDAAASVANLKSLARGIGAAAALAVLVGTGVAEAQSLAPVPPPKPGDCKRAPELAHGPTAAQAQQIWAAQVTGKFNAHWSHWFAAQDKALIPVHPNLWRAMARPYYFLPVP